MYARIDSNNKVIEILSGRISFFDKNGLLVNPEIFKYATELANLDIYKITNTEVPENFDHTYQTKTIIPITIGDDFEPQEWDIVNKVLTLKERINIVRNVRAGLYPTLGDQADADFKARQGDNSMQLVIDAEIQSIKDNNPIPM